MRPIKPEILTSADFLALSSVGKLLFMTLIVLSDDEGRQPTDARRLQNVVAQDVTEKTCLRQLAIMEDRGMVRSYKVNRVAYVQLSNWAQHQKPQHPLPSTYPAPPADDAQPSLPLEGSELMSSQELDSSRARGGRGYTRKGVTKTGTKTETGVSLQELGDEETVFAAWAESLGDRDVTLTPGRRQKIRSRLERYSVEALCAAVSIGWQADAARWPERANQNDLTQLLGSDEKAEKFINLAKTGAPAPTMFKPNGEAARLAARMGIGGNQ